MVCAPRRLADTDVLDRLEILALRVDRNRQPRWAAWCLDPVAIPPVPTCVLYIVKQHELVDRMDQVEISLPRDIARLQDRDSHRALSNNRDRWLVAAADGQLPGECATQA